MYASNMPSITYFSWPRVQLYEMFDLKTKKRDVDDLWCKWWAMVTTPVNTYVATWSAYQHRGDNNDTY